MLRLEAGAPTSELVKQLGVRQKLIYEWLSGCREQGIASLNPERGPKPGKLRMKREPAGDTFSQAKARLAEL